MTDQIYIRPKFPDHSFVLIAPDNEWSLGPFNPDGWGQGADGSMVYSDGYAYPTVLRVQSQEGNILRVIIDASTIEYEITASDDPRVINR